MDRLGKGITSGRKKKSDVRKLTEDPESGAPRRKRRPFSESVLFTLGLAFVILYFAGLLAASGPSVRYDGTEAVAVMAESDAEVERDRSLWDLLDECLSDVFKGRGAED